MQNRWQAAAAAEFVSRYREHGEVLALRIYTSRLLGQDRGLVLHGGGNTSVKTTKQDLLGRSIDVLCVKGSGSDLAQVGPNDLPAVRLAPLVELRQLPQLSDQAMVDAVRGALLDSRAPNPSVETLLHAFLPHRFVDHTHADAILALTDQPDPERHVRQALGDGVVVLPWIMPGFPLAKAVAAAFERQPDCRGIVLLKHGLFTFGDDAETSYARTIELVDAAERYLAQRMPGGPAMLGGNGALPAAERQALLARALPVVRGALALPNDSRWGQDQQRVIADARTADDLAAFAADPGAPALCASNPVTPDHVLRTKPHYLWLSRAAAVDPEATRTAVAAWADRYRSYFQGHAARLGFAMLPPMPIVVVIDGVGLAAFGSNPKAAAIAADIAEHTLRTKARAAALGSYQPLTDAELAEMEYWPLERSKLGSAAAPLLQGQVALVTGAAGAIGAGIVEALLAAGAAVFATDVDGERLAKATARLADASGRLRSGTADLTDPAAVARLFDDCCRAFGGVDIVVPNAGIAHTGTLDTMDLERFQRVQQVNVHGTLTVLQQAVAAMKAQRTGGSIIVQASKNTFAPGAGFGAYSASKAAALQLMRIAAIEFAPFGVRVNAINADAVFGDDEVPSQLWEMVGPDRMRARNLDAKGLRDYYRQRSLLKVEVTPRAVGEAVVFFAAGRTPTTGAVLPVDAGLPEAFPR
jgi:rhamnose utilization protein RhaD (predicted bifunctional aldolase and dehydrogenase)/NAD(P)-dependent dehydrogenase (short-subunit alcohol dehydrogenase family)